MSTQLGMRRQNNGGRMEYYRAQVSAKKDCIPALVNTIFQNPPLPLSQYDCIHASRKVLCGNCSTRIGVSYEFPPSPQPLDAPPLTPFIAPLESSEKKTKLSKKNAAVVQDKLKSFGRLVCNAERDKRKYRHLPDAIHFPCTLIHSLVTNFESISNCIDLDPYLLNWIHRVDYRLQLDDVLSDLRVLIKPKSKPKSKTSMNYSKKGKRKARFISPDRESGYDQDETMVESDDSLAFVSEETLAANNPVPVTSKQANSSGKPKSKRPRSQQQTLAEANELYGRKYNTTRTERAARG
ncbi:hypothetical protein K435DRAFT_880336 [Dendrothele bispora CBS 962.96]|uniref:Uncharacterized protein n=1 Tax=Dendrothele bispora (strain CBS 962.96) TaxID=1314807 RepID=A0A4S8KJM8_DENBC|nr:hypothetical protein K435DRAFT_880336 [Dendrothele bispora CBS 962.96]